MPKYTKQRKVEIDAAVKRDVLKAVYRILRKRRFDWLTTDMVVEEAGISIGTLYNHFAGKDEIIAFVIEKSLRPLLAAQTRIAQSEMSFVDKLVKITSANISKDYEIQNRLLMMADMFSPKYVAVLDSLKKAALPQIEAMFADGIARGVMRKIDIRYPMLMFAAISRIARTMWNTARAGGAGREQIASEAVGIFLRGIASRRRKVVPVKAEPVPVPVGETPKDRIYLSVMAILNESRLDRVSSNFFSMSKIAARLGYTKAALYKHFKNKDSLLAYVIGRLIESRDAARQEVAKGKGSVFEKLTALAEIETDMISGDIAKLSDVAGNTRYGGDLSFFHKVVAGSRKRLQKCLLEIMRRGLSQGRFRRISAELLVEYFMLAVYSLLDKGYIRTITNPTIAGK